MASDIGSYGTGDGLGFYWVRVEQQWGGGHCELIAIDELGAITTTPGRRDYDPAARTHEEAGLHHLAPAIRQADADLERRRREMPDEGEAPPPAPLDPATARFLSDPD